jgi:membrane protein implicated in regulation of membrane protease activity
MKTIRHIGSLAFVLGLFTAVFVGVPWSVMVADDPVEPWWLRLAVFCLLGGILMVLATLALEQRVLRKSAEAQTATGPDRRILL